MKAAEPYKKELDAKIQKWRKEYNGEPYGNERKNRSSIVSRDIKRQSEWQHAAILDPFVSNDNIIQAYPITPEDARAARQNNILLNYQFCRQFPRYNFLNKALKVLDRDGTLIVRLGWEYEEKTIVKKCPIYEVDEKMQDKKEVGTEEVEVTIPVKNHPTAEVCRTEDVYVDPTCGDDMERCQFVIHRFETSVAALKQAGIYYNLDKIDLDAGDATTDYDYMPTSYKLDGGSFQFKDKSRKKIVVYEYWGYYDIDEDGELESIVCAWVGDTIIRLEENPYPDKKPPFLVVPFNSVPFQLFGEANAEILSDAQKVKTAILRGILDNMALSNNGQIGIRKGSLDALNRTRMLNGENFEFNGSPQDIWQGNFNPIPGSVFNMIQLVNGEIESLTGVAGFMQGINGTALGNTATAVNRAVDSASVRRLNIVRNIAENLIKPMIRRWMEYNAVFLSPEEVIRVTNEEFVTIRRDDLQGQIDIGIDVTTSEDNRNKAQELSFLLQTIGPNEDPEIRRMLIADILELLKMPEKANKFLHYRPQPDPLQQQMAQLQIAKLQAEIENIKASTQDEVAKAHLRGYDSALREARIESEKAKAHKILSDADLAKLEAIKKNYNIDHLNELEKMMAKAELEKTKKEHSSLVDLGKEQASAAIPKMPEGVGSNGMVDYVTQQYNSTNRR